jgi:hypothetical protein
MFFDDFGPALVISGMISLNETFSKTIFLCPTTIWQSLDQKLKKIVDSVEGLHALST